MAPPGQTAADRPGGGRQRHRRRLDDGRPVGEVAFLAGLFLPLDPTDNGMALETGARRPDDARSGRWRGRGSLENPLADHDSSEPIAPVTVEATNLGWKPGEWKQEIEYAANWYQLARVDRNAENEVVSARYLGERGIVLVVTK